jgi:hypothetical protein
MPDDWKARYLEALRPLNLRAVARETGRGYRTLHSYLSGERGIPPKAAEELVEYLQSRSRTLTAAAKEIETALLKEKNE